MVVITLPDRYIEEGRTLISALEQENFTYIAAMWLYSDEEDEWLLTIATPLVDELGPRETYRKVQTALSKLPSIYLSLSDVSVVSPRNHLITAIRGTVGHSKDIAIKGTVMDGIFSPTRQCSSLFSTGFWKH